MVPEVHVPGQEPDLLRLRMAEIMLPVVQQRKVMNELLPLS